MFQIGAAVLFEGAANFIITTEGGTHETRTGTYAYGVLANGCPGPAACGEEAPAIPTVAITAKDYEFSAPASIAGGLTRLALKNDGPESHHAALVRLNDGVTVEQFQSTLQDVLQAAQTEGEAAFGRLFAILTLASGPAAVPTGGTSEVVVSLQPGQYMLLCFVPSPDGVPHLAKGMVKPLSVTTAAAKQPKEPTAQATVRMADFSFQGLASLSKGKTTVKVVNEGQEPHEMNVYRLKGITVGEFTQIVTTPAQPGAAPPAGPPPFEEAGGFGANMPGQSGWVTLDLTPGEYALVCFIPSAANQGAPHVALGMVGGLTVR